MKALVGLAVMLLAARAEAAEGVPWRVVKGDVRVLCPLTMGGSFEAKTTALSGTVTFDPGRPGDLAGTLEVDLGTLDTGIDLRTHHLKDVYLEIAKGEGYAHAALSDLRVAALDGAGFQGRSPFTATLTVHGQKHGVAGQAEVRREGAAVRVDAAFPVVIADYGIAPPRYLGVGVTGQVRVKVSLVAEGPSAPGKH